MSESPNGILPNKLEQWFTRQMLYFTRFLSQSRVTPNTITIISLFFGLLAGIFIALHLKVLALISFILMGVLDILDGQLAVHTGQTSQFGAVLDSTIDRYNEAFIYTGFGIYFYRLDQPLWILVAAAALIGSVLVSYVKARAEGAQLSCRVGLLQRAERLVLLGLGILTHGWVLKTILLILAVMTNVTVVQRLYNVKSEWLKQVDGN